MKPAKTPLSAVITTYGIAIACFTIFRIALLMVSAERIPAEGSVALLAQSFLMGFRFDTVIVCYVLMVPTMLIWLNALINSNWPTRAAFGYIKVFLLLSFLVCAIDIPYFVFHSVRLNKMIFDWLVASPAYVAKMVVMEPSFWAVGLVPLILVSMLFLWAFRRCVQQPGIYRRLSNRVGHWLSLSLVMLLLVFGARGRLSAKSPIRPGTAFFSSNAFANLLSLNPVYTLLNSLKHKEGEPLVDGNEALDYVRRQFGVAPGKPLAREVRFHKPMRKLNVMLVVMESMAAKKTGFLHGKGLTPEMDRLSTQSVSFRNAYTLGIHTFNGLYSSVYGLPSTFNEHPMKVFPIPKVGGLATTLKTLGYSTHFFVISDGEFDNMAGFFTHNDFDHVISQADFPRAESISSIGVPDHVMFDKSIEYLRKVKEPFFVTYMTGSDHGPYVVPKNIPFKPKSTDKKDRTTEYADWSIRKFLNDAKGEPWFENTLFVFVADHGSPIDSIYDISLEYHHTPLFFYSPKYLKAEVKDDLISQVDIYPSVMGVLRAPYVNESLGVDVFSSQRKMIPINSDSVLGAMDHKYLYVYRKDNESLYEWPTSSLDDVKASFPEDVHRLKDFSLNFFQAGRELVRPSKSKAP